MLLELDGHDVRAVYSAMDALEQVTGFRARDRPARHRLARDERLRRGAADQGDAATTAACRLSGYAQREDKERSAAAGFSTHLVKPVDIAELKKVLGA